MKRRDFLLTSLATSAAISLAPLAAHAELLTYTPGLVKEKLAAGETVFIEVNTEWCTTCAAQKRVMEALKADNPAYEKNVTFVNMDWDDHKRSELAKELKIPRRSTLIVLRGDAELGRIVAGTGTDEIKALMDTALKAAMM